MVVVVGGGGGGGGGVCMCVCVCVREGGIEGGWGVGAACESIS